ncbi:hypothetical protein FSP39_006440 [Pinctada imbricata]|uniref:HMG box domain-containing protein n=1 Tax=Pinctada imbricata TaxID=66713 RepID=A0AA88XJS3_PINIB|nr:hypothetical protein FSP39_006440 [Pinctada imbricata]
MKENSMLGLEIPNQMAHQSGGLSPSVSELPTDSIQNANFISEAFHTPGFGEDFDLTHISLPDVTEALGQDLQQNNCHLTNLSHIVYRNMDFNPTQQQSPNGNQGNTAIGTEMAPIFPPQNFEVPDIAFTNNLHMTTNSSLESMAMVTNSINTSSHNGSILSPSFLPSTVAPSGGQQLPGTGTSPVVSRESSTEDSDDSLPLAKLAQLKRQAGGREKTPTPPPPVTTTTTGKTRKTPKKRRKKDPNEPQKPVSAYALFFRDTQAAIKGQNPSASFGEVSKIVASMWDGLDTETKSVYKKKTEMAKKEYLKQLAAYRASLVSQLPMDDTFGDPLLDKTRLTRSSLHAANPNLSPHHQHSPSLSPHHGNGMSPMHAPNMSPQTQGIHLVSNSPHGSNSMSPPGHGISPPHAHGLSPSQHGMSPSQGHGLSPVHGGNMANMVTSPQHGGNMSPAIENMGMMIGLGMSPQHHAQSPPQGQLGYNSPMHNDNNNSSPQRPPLAPATQRNQQNITQRQPVLGQLMEEANLCLDGGGMLQSMCVRNGCTNPTIENPGWDNEYCSNECVVSHCR